MIVEINKHVSAIALKHVLEYHDSKIKNGKGSLFKNSVDFSDNHDVNRIYDAFETFMKATSPRSNHQRYHHIALNFSSTDVLKEHDKVTILYLWLAKMKYDQTQHIIYRHTDKAHDHFHIVCSSTLTNGKKIDSYKDHIRSADFSREIENAFGLKVLNPVGKGESFDRFEKYRYAYALTQLSQQELAASAFDPIRNLDYKNLSNDQIQYAYGKHRAEDSFKTKVLPYLRQQGYLKDSLKTRIYKTVMQSIGVVQSVDGLLTEVQKSGIYARRVKKKNEWTIQFGDAEMNIYVSGEKVDKKFSIQGLTDTIKSKRSSRSGTIDPGMGM